MVRPLFRDAALAQTHLDLWAPGVVDGHLVFQPPAVGYHHIGTALRMSSASDSVCPSGMRLQAFASLSRMTRTSPRLVTDL